MSEDIKEFIKGEIYGSGSNVWWVCPRCGHVIVTSESQLLARIAEHARKCKW